jgi:diguanylate cyclase (GGDEF)-like protein
MLDVDHFKKYNDYYGHLNGDRCLQKIAEALKTTVKRGTDIVARFGGEEFVVILPDTNLQDATLLADRLRQFVFNLGIPHPDSDVSNFVTISLGIATTGEHLFTDGTQLVDAADKALYHAKRNGRNRFEVL